MTGYKITVYTYGPQDPKDVGHAFVGFSSPGVPTVFVGFSPRPHVEDVRPFVGPIPGSVQDDSDSFRKKTGIQGQEFDVSKGQFQAALTFAAEAASYQNVYVLERRGNFQCTGFVRAVLTAGGISPPSATGVVPPGTFDWT
jgi:hypothetical protein